MTGCCSASGHSSSAQDEFERVAIGVRPSTLLALHQALVRRRYRRLFSSSECSKQPGPSALATWVKQARADRTKGKTGLTTEERAEVIRCLKRFLAREIFQRVMADYRARQAADLAA